MLHKLKEEKKRLQSAMEYLMTYGWAILVIAVVLAVLFELGVFNPYSYISKAPPGSCSVYRPYGPNSSQLLNLEGTCSGEIPEYALSTKPDIPATCTATSNIPVPLYIPLHMNYFTSYLPNSYNPNSLTISWWAYYSPKQLPSSTYFHGAEDMHLGTSDPTTGGDGVWCGAGSCNIAYATPNSISAPGYVPNKWLFYTFVANYTAKTAVLYINGVPGTPAVWSSHFNEISYLAFGAYSNNFGCADVMNGSLANAQFYAIALTQSQVSTLYLRGIGGAPIDLENLIGWWPLNGDANDYSGNRNNAIPTNVIYYSTWYNYYIAP